MARIIPVTLDLDPETTAALDDPVFRSSPTRPIQQAAHASITGQPIAKPADTVARFHAFAAAHTLGDLDPRTLISRGRR